MEIFACRLCNGPLQTVLDLGKLHISGFFIEGENDGPSIPQPLTLAQCTYCGFTQLKHILDPDLMYRKYWYRSSLNPSMIVALRNIVDSTMDIAKTNGKQVDVVLDIGANDGTMLAMYPDGITRIGFDPALNLSESAQENCDHFVADYFTADKWPDLPHADIVTAIAMFYDLNDPHSFLEDVSKVIKDDGIFVIQMTDLISMLRANAFDNICHEHAGYYTFTQLHTLLTRHGFYVFRVEHNLVNGGSIRVYCTKKPTRHKIDDTVFRAIAQESIYLSNYDDPIMAFSFRVMNIGLSIMKFIMDWKALDGRKIYALGASTKGNTLLQYFGLSDKIIEAVGEINEDKFGKRTVGTGIPIVPESEILEEAGPEDIIMILPWHFRDFFIGSLNGHIEVDNLGTTLLFPLPEPQLVNMVEGNLLVRDLEGSTIIGWAK